MKKKKLRVTVHPRDQRLCTIPSSVVIAVGETPPWVDRTLSATYRACEEVASSHDNRY